MDTTNSEIQWLLNAAIVLLKDASDTAKLDAELFMCHVLSCNRTYLMTWPDKRVEEAQRQAFQQLLERRLKGEPVAHIIGHRAFWTLDLEVNPSTLIPRPDTELLVELALDVAMKKPSSNNKALDLGTGTGAIALALASELPQWHILGVDYSEDAVALAKRNKANNQINNAEFLQSDWYSEVAGQKFDLIVSNPPYIDPTDKHLSEGDVRFEPLSALIAEESGLADLRFIIEHSRQFLNDNGALLLEHGYDQASAVQALLIENGFQQVETFKDLGANDRVSIGYF